jgi:hypothetical protein
MAGWIGAFIFIMILLCVICGAISGDDIHTGPRGGKYRVVNGRKRYDVP